MREKKVDAACSACSFFLTYAFSAFHSLSSVLDSLRCEEATHLRALSKKFRRKRRCSARESRNNNRKNKNLSLPPSSFNTRPPQ
jgi:hypothetical protein